MIDFFVYDLKVHSYPAVRCDEGEKFATLLRLNKTLMR